MALGCCILCGAALLDPQRKGVWLTFAALAVGLVIMSQSKTSLVLADAGP